MKLRVAKRLHDGLVAAQHIEQFVSGRTFDDYQSDIYFRSAVERQFEILSESLKKASNRDSSLFKTIPEIAPIITMRNRIAHSYDVLDDAIVWKAATELVPELSVRLQELLSEFHDPSMLEFEPH